MGGFVDFYSIDNIRTVYDQKIKYRSGGGIDRVTARKFEKNKENYFEHISNNICAGTYKFSPFLEKLVSKGRAQLPRVISVPTIRDKLTLTIFNQYLQSQYEHCVPTELPNQRVRRLRDFFQTELCKDVEIVRLDISKFYDSIDHEIMLKRLKGENALSLSLITKAINNPTIPFNSPQNERKNYVPRCGVPQGLPISNILAEIYLDDIDCKLSEHALFYDRYVDDVIAIVSQPKEFMELSKNALENIRLKLNEEKSTHRPLDGEITYLGYSFSSKRISVKTKSYEKFISGINALFNEFKRNLSADARIQGGNTINITSNFFEDLNIKIAGARYDKKRYGWVYYFSQIDDLALLHKIDSFVRRNIKQTKIMPDVKIKSALRAYYHIKSKSDQGYTHDYSSLSLDEMRAFLRRRSLIKDGEELSMSEIKFRYTKFVISRLSQLEEDLGKDY